MAFVYTANFIGSSYAGGKAANEAAADANQPKVPFAWREPEASRTLRPAGFGLEGPAGFRPLVRPKSPVGQLR
jgi:hypothetical protein